jgi:amino acid adenylation domain-containing protein
MTSNNEFKAPPWSGGEAGRIALEHEGRAMPYSELHTRTLAVAGWLGSMSGGDGGLVVGVLVDHPLHLAITILGALDSGATVVPIEASTPLDRVGEIVDETGMRLMLCDADRQAALAVAFPEVRCQPCEELIESDQVAANAKPWGDFLLYTSGSTGRPKGVPLHGTMLLNEGRKTAEVLRIRGEDRVSHVLSPALLSGIRELLGGLAGGGTVVILPARSLSSSQLSQQLSERGITVCRMVPTLFRSLAPQLNPQFTRRIHTLYIAGEALLGSDVELLRRCFQPETRLVNIFGASEYGICFGLEITPDLAFPAEAIVPVGYPLKGYRLSVVDSQGQPQPDDQEGCLLVESPSVVRGYWKQPATADSPFGESTADPDCRTFLTADLFKRDSKGCFSFIGRSDHQVKLNGQRIELGEIEARLEGHPCVSECCALIFEANGRQRLAAAVCLNQEVKDTQLVDAGTLRTYLGKSLPTHMLPTSFLFPESMPLTGNGKIDRHALRRQFAAAPANEPKGVPPDTWEEQDLLVLWRDLLQLPNLGVTDGFFESGGDSLLAARLLAQIAQTLGVELPMTALLIAPTVRDMAAELTKGRVRDQNTYCYQAKHGNDDHTVISIGMRVERLLEGLSLSPDAQIWCIKYPGTQLFLPDGRIHLGELARNCAAEWAVGCAAKRPVIVGFSFGATLAYALACELAALGRAPACVLLEPGTPPNEKTKRRTPTDLLRLLREPAQLRGRIATELERRVLRRTVPPPMAGGPPGEDVPDTRLTAEAWMELSGAERWILFGKEYRRSIAAHQYKAFDGPVTIMGRSQWRDEVQRFWTRLARVSWEITPEATEHEDMLRDDILDRCFARIKEIHSS